MSGQCDSGGAIEPADAQPGPRQKFCDTVMPWEEIKEVIVKRELHRLLRMRDVWFKYLARCDEIEAQYETLGDYILAQTFNLPTRIASSNKIEAIVPERTEPILLWRPNEFPYAFPADVSHDLLWSTGELTEEIILEEIEREKPASRYETLYFVNTANLRSIHNVSHAHIISRIRKQ